MKVSVFLLVFSLWLFRLQFEAWSFFSLFFTWTISFALSTEKWYISTHKTESQKHLSGWIKEPQKERKIPPNKPPTMADKIAKMMNNIIIAGMEAITHFTIKITMEENGIWISSIDTHCTWPLLDEENTSPECVICVVCGCGLISSNINPQSHCFTSSGIFLLHAGHRLNASDITPSLQSAIASTECN